MALKRVSGLWLKKGKQGKYMRGDVREPIPAGAQLLVFRNNRKQTDSDPDYTLSLAVDDEDAETSHDDHRQRRADAQTAAAGANNKDARYDGPNIPF